MDDVIEQKRDVMPSAWVPKGGEKRAAKDAGRVRTPPRDTGERCEGREEDP